MSTMRVVAPSPVTILRWMARALSLLGLLVWGAFLAEHVSQWFVASGPWPPPAVILLSLAHLALVVGFALAWRWELAGGVLILGAGLVFFAGAAGRYFPQLFVPTAIPALLFLYCWWRTRGS